VRRVRRQDLASTVNGGYIVDASNRFFGDPRSMLMPGPAVDVSEGGRPSGGAILATTG
jgi:allantoicase